MNKYVAIANSFCDACVNGNTCKHKGTCKRVSEMVKLAERYEKVSSAFDRVCIELTTGTNWFMDKTKDEVKEHFLNGK